MRSLTAKEREVLSCFLSLLPDASDRLTVAKQIEAAQVRREDGEHLWFTIPSEINALGDLSVLEGGETLSLQFSDFDGESIESLLHFYDGVMAWCEWYSLVIGRPLHGIPSPSSVIYKQ